MKRLGHLSLLILTVLLAILAPVVALAQDVLVPPPAAPGAPGGPAWVTSLLQYIVLPLIPAIGAVIVAALGKLALFLHSKEQNSKVAGVFAIATDFVENAFEHIRAGMEADFKVALADGKLDPVERAALLAKLLALVKAELPSGIQAALQAVFGAGLNTWLSGKASAVIDAAAQPKSMLLTSGADISPQPT